MAESNKPEDIIKKEPISIGNNKIKNLGTPLGYIFTFYCFFVFFIGIIAIWMYGIMGYIVVYVLRMSCFWIDEKTSNATELNKGVLIKNGFKPEEILRSAKVKGFFRGLFNYPIFQFFLSDVEPYFNIWLIINIAIALVITEIYFTQTHKWLHRYKPEWHRQHHCCIYPSMTTNLVFDELDLFLEFTLPILIVFLTHSFILKDSFAGMLGVCLIQGWYIIAHDEYLRLHHWHHHRYINSKYNIYIEGGEYDSLDKIRDSVIR